MTSVASGSIYVDDNCVNTNVLYFNNSIYTVNTSTRLAAVGIKVGFRERNIEDRFINFDIECNVLDNYNLNQKLCSVHFNAKKNSLYKEIYFDQIYFKSVLRTQSIVSFKTNNPNIYIKHIICIYNNYG